MQDGFSAINELATQEAERIKTEKEAAEKLSQEQAKKEKEYQGGDSGEDNQDEKEKIATDELAAAKEAEDKRLADEAAAANAGNDKKDPPAPTVDPFSELLKETNFKTIDELKAHIAKKDSKEDTPEEKKRKDDVYRANLNNYAVENSIMSNDDIVKFETLKSKSDRDLVFEKFSQDIRGEIEDDLKAENPAVTDEEIEKEIKEAFEIEYPVDSTNQKAKDRAANKIAKEAKDIRGPFESSFNEAKARFDEEVSVRNEYPGYQKAIKQVITEAIPDSHNFFKDKAGDKDDDPDIPIDIQISEDDKKEILKTLQEKLQNPQTFLLHKNGKVDDLKAMVRNELDYLLWKKYGDIGKKEIATKFLKVGMGKGSDTGAKESFATKQAKPEAVTKKSAADLQQEVIDSTRKK